MSDLISRSALIENLREIKTLYGVPMTNRDEQMIHWIIGHIKEQPTAYDISKVVAELEELANHYHKCCLVDYNEGAEVGVRESMAIVRKGGVE